MGPDYFPRSGEGRLLALFLAVYGYVTATVASFFIEKDNHPSLNKKSEEMELQNLRHEVLELKELVRKLNRDR
jgi:voltage-gated potassium channel